MAASSSNSKRSPRSRKEASPTIASFDGLVPPQAIDMEKAVLGALMLEKDSFFEVSQLLTAGSFYVKAHELIFEAIQTLAAAQKPIDMLTVTEELRRVGNLDLVGGAVYISELTTNVAGAANLAYHAHIVADKATGRELISFASKVITDAYADNEEVDLQVQQAEAKLFELSQQKMRNDTVRADSLLPIVLQRIQDAANKSDGISGLASGFDRVDRITAGWQPGELIVIGARPAMGKTAFALTMLKSISIDREIPTLFFSLEMSNEDLMNRIVSNVCEIPLHKLRTGQLEPYEWETLSAKQDAIQGKPLYLDETPGLSIFELRSKARRAVHEKGVQMIVIDYLQLMSAEGFAYGSREQEISLISRSLKSLAKELSIPIIALAQLNRDIEKRQQGEANSRQPQLSDLRESGAIEQDADIVCFLHRPEVYNILTFPEDNTSTKGMAVFVIAKNRNGEIGDFRLSFRGEYAKFTSADTPSMIQNTIVGGVGGGDFMPF